MSEDDEIRMTLRLPETLRDRLKGWADESGRSMNAEIVARLESSAGNGMVGASDLQKHLQNERDAYSKMEKLYDSTLEVAHGYRGLLASANGQIMQFASMVKSLAGIILNLDGPPPAELIDVAKRMEEAASDTKERFSSYPDLDRAREELRSLDKSIAKAETLLGKARE